VKHINFKSRGMLLAAVLLLSTTPLWAGNTSLPHIPLPTHGGKFVWQDVYIYADWRIQKNVLTGHHRLLDTYNIRRAWGSYTHTKSKLDSIKTDKALKPASQDMVMLIHGITPVVNPFEKIETALKKAGYDTVAISYPSTLASIKEHASSISKLISRLEGTERIHFVCHSMGCLVLRYLLSKTEKQVITQRIGRIVMIAPPNQGSALARMLKDLKPFQLIYGNAGQDLTPIRAQNIPHLSQRFIIIAGGKGDGKGYNPLIKGDDDGTVGVKETFLLGAAKTTILPKLHSHVGDHSAAVKLTLDEITSAPPLKEVSK